MANAATSSAGKVQLRYETIRNLTSPEEKANGARSYFANVPIGEQMLCHRDPFGVTDSGVQAWRESAPKSPYPSVTLILGG